jgi:hypothetical protein
VYLFAGKALHLAKNAVSSTQRFFDCCPINWIDCVTRAHGERWVVRVSRNLLRAQKGNPLSSICSRFRHDEGELITSIASCHVDVAAKDTENGGRPAQGSASAIIRRNPAPVRPGDELRKSIQTGRSTRIKRGFSLSPLSRPSSYRFQCSGEWPSGFPSAPAIPGLYA